MSIIFNHFNNLLNQSRENLNNANDDKGLPEDYELYMQCVKEFKKRKYLQIIKMDYEQNLFLSKLKTIEDKTKQNLKIFRAEKRLDRYIFLTINPPDNKLTPHELLKICKKAMSRKFIEKYHFVIEQRGMTIDENGKGMHAHLLFSRNINYKPAIIKRDLKNTFKKCYNKINDSNFNFKKCGKEFYEARLSYIKGNKTGDSKTEKMTIDDHFRKKFKLKTIYEN